MKLKCVRTKNKECALEYDKFLWLINIRYSDIPQAIIYVRAALKPQMHICNHQTKIQQFKNFAVAHFLCWFILNSAHFNSFCTNLAKSLCVKYTEHLLIA